MPAVVSVGTDAVEAFRGDLKGLERAEALSRRRRLGGGTGDAIAAMALSRLDLWVSKPVVDRKEVSGAGGEPLTASRSNQEKIFLPLRDGYKDPQI